MNIQVSILAIIGFLGTLSLPASPITALAFSPDGLTLASSGHERVDLRSVDDDAIRSCIHCGFPRVTSLAFDGDDRLIGGGGIPGVSGAASIFELRTKTASRQFSGFSDLVTCVSASPNGQWLAIGSADHSAAIYSLGINAPPTAVQLVGHSGPVLALAFTPGNDLLITASADRSIKTWTLKGELVRSLNQHTEAVHALVIRPGDAAGIVECASGSDDGTVRIWQPAIGRMVRIIRGHEGPIFALACTPQGTALFSAGKEGVIRQLDIESDQILAEQIGHTDAIYSLAVAPNGRKLASGDWSGKVKLWDLTANGSLAHGKGL